MQLQSPNTIPQHVHTLCKLLNYVTRCSLLFRWNVVSHNQGFESLPYQPIRTGFVWNWYPSLLILFQRQYRSLPEGTDRSSQSWSPQNPPSSVGIQFLYGYWFDFLNYLLLLLDFTIPSNSGGEVGDTSYKEHCYGDHDLATMLRIPCELSSLHW